MSVQRFKPSIASIYPLHRSIRSLIHLCCIHATIASLPLLFPSFNPPSSSIFTHQVQSTKKRGGSIPLPYSSLPYTLSFPTRRWSKYLNFHGTNAAPNALACRPGQCHQHINVDWIEKHTHLVRITEAFLNEPPQEPKEKSRVHSRGEIRCWWYLDQERGSFQTKALGFERDCKLATVLSWERPFYWR